MLTNIFELFIPGDSATAVERLAYLSSNDLFPTYVRSTLSAIQHTADMLNQSGVPTPAEVPTCLLDLGIPGAPPDDEYIDDDNAPNPDIYLNVIPRSFSINSDRVRCNLNLHHVTYCKELVANAALKQKALMIRCNQVEASDQCPSSGFVPRADHTELENKVDTMFRSMSRGQLETIAKITKHLNEPEGPPLCMFMSGEGGTGKSYIIPYITALAKLRKGRTAGAQPTYYNSFQYVSRLLCLRY